MGKRVPLTNGVGGPTIGTAMLIASDDPVKEFAAFTRIDGVMVGLIITDPHIRRLIQGDLSSLSIRPRCASEDTQAFVDHIENGQEMARGMQDEIDADFNVDGKVDHTSRLSRIYDPNAATQHITRFIPGGEV